MAVVDPTPSSSHTNGVRRPVSQRRYMARRLGALLVLGGLVVGAVWGVGLLVRESGGSAASDSPPTTSAVEEAPSSSVPSPDTTGARTAAVARPDETTADAPEEPAGPPTPQNPASIYIAGDSDAGMFGPYLEELVAETGVAETALDYEVSSGLARPDFFDWPQHLQDTIPEVDPDIVVITLGGNDAQGLSEASSEEYVIEPADIEPAKWRAEYGRRVGEVMDFLAADGRTLVWVGIPNTASHERTERLRIQDQVVREQVEQRPDVLFVDTWSRFSGRDGGYADYVIDPRDGQGKLVRADDDFHLNSTGAEILALDIAETIRNELRDRGADI